MIYQLTNLFCLPKQRKILLDVVEGTRMLVVVVIEKAFALNFDQIEAKYEIV